MTNAITTATRPAMARGYARETPLSEDESEVAVRRAIIYLRVSSPSQVKTDYNPEGISLPAQRDACEFKCASLGAAVAHEFIEPGRSATTIDKRIAEGNSTMRRAASRVRPIGFCKSTAAPSGNCASTVSWALGGVATSKTASGTAVASDIELKTRRPGNSRARASATFRSRS